MKLKSCPFCGGDALTVYTADKQWWIVCKFKECCETQLFDTEKQVRKVWNTRTKERE